MEGPCIAVLRAACFRIRVPIPEQIILSVRSRPSREHHAFNTGGIGHFTGNIIALVGDIGHLHIADDRAVLIAYRDIHHDGADAFILPAAHIDRIDIHLMQTCQAGVSTQTKAMIGANNRRIFVIHVRTLCIGCATQDHIIVQTDLNRQLAFAIIPVKSPAVDPDRTSICAIAVNRTDRAAAHTLEQAHGDIALHAIIQDMSQIAGAVTGSLAHIDILAFSDHANLIAPVFAVAGVDVGTAAACFLIPACISCGAAQFISVRVGLRFCCTNIFFCQVLLRINRVRLSRCIRYHRFFGATCTNL